MGGLTEGPMCFMGMGMGDKTVFEGKWPLNLSVFYPQPLLTIKKTKQ